MNKIQNKATLIISNALKNNKLSHAYLFYGESGVDVETPIFESLKLIFKHIGKEIHGNNINELNHFDLKIIKPNNEGIIIKEKVDTTLNTLFESTLEKNSIKILYIKDIDKGNKHSLNRLLKFLEEPANNLIFFFGTNNYDGVISTIRSRTQNIFIKRESIEIKTKKLKGKYDDQYIKLLANIYSNIDEVDKMDFNLFSTTYEKIITTLEKALLNKSVLISEFNEIWQKNNNSYFLNILKYFFYQIQINNDDSLFPKQIELINKYKIKNIDYYKIQLLIEKTKKNINSYANFSLQKIDFLTKLEEEFKI